MSLLRQRATEVRVLSTLRALRPADARLRLVSETRAFSDALLKLPSLQAAAGAGRASEATEVMAKTTATRMPTRRVMRSWNAGAREARVMNVGSSLPGRSLGWQRGFWCGLHPRQRVRSGPRRDGPGRVPPRYRWVVERSDEFGMVRWSSG